MYGKFKVNFIYDNNLKYLDKISKNEEIKRLTDKDTNEGFLGLDLGLKNLVT
jgi:hypothetical protein